MISTLGPVVLALGTGLSLVATGLWVMAARGRDGAVAPARWLTALTFLAALAVVVLMEIALVRNDFSVSYVAENSGRAVPLYYRVTGLWSALEGSLLLWLLVLSGYALALARRPPRAHDLHGWAMAVMNSVTVFFFGLALATSSAFSRVDPAPADGPGPNPLLQDHWLMAFHPPLLYLGYVGLTVPFAYAMAALLTGRTDRRWLVPVRRWTLLSWSALTVGIVLGMWWAYAVLGWGGYWAWDPVENASILPWFTATALLHSVLVQERRQILGVWNISLASATFVMVLIGTFITRSGVVASVHAFTQSAIGPALLSYTVAVVLVVVGLLIWRSDRLVPTQRIERVASREAVILVNNVLFVTLTATVLLGTIFPLLREAVGGGPTSVGAPYFNDIVVPIAIVVIALMGIGPLVPWGGGPQRIDTGPLVVPAFVGLAVLAGAALTVAGGVRSAVAYGVAAFAAAAVVTLLARDSARARREGETWAAAVGRVLVRRRRRYGAMVSHLGVVLFILAVTASSTLASTGDATLRQGESLTVSGYTVTLDEVVRERTPRFMEVAARTVVTRDEHEVADLAPQLRFYPTLNEAIGRPAVRTGWTADLYLTVSSVDAEGESAHVRLTVSPMIMWLWISGAVIVAGAALAGWPARPAREEGGRVRRPASSRTVQEGAGHE